MTDLWDALMEMQHIIYMAKQEMDREINKMIRKEKPIEELLTPKTIEKLKQLGKENDMKENDNTNAHTVKTDFTFNHYRKGRRWVTFVEVKITEVGVGYLAVMHGMAICNPEDTFDQSIGERIAIKDATRHLKRDTRTWVWTAYKDARNQK